MNDDLESRLRDRAAEVVGDVRLDHPGNASVTQIEGRERSRRPWILGVAAAVLVLVAAGGLWLSGSGDDEQRVISPATATPEEVVRAAVERTLSVSWVADVDGSPGADGSAQSVTIVHQPDGATPGLAGAAISLTQESPSGGSSVELIGTESVELHRCHESYNQCDGSWRRSPASGSLSERVLVGNVDAASAERSSDGVYRADWDQSTGGNCTGCDLLVTVEDGLIVRIDHRDPAADGEAVSMSLREFGTAPEIDMPAESEIDDL